MKKTIKEWMDKNYLPLLAIIIIISSLSNYYTYKQKVQLEQNAISDFRNWILPMVSYSDSLDVKLANLYVLKDSTFANIEEDLEASSEYAFLLERHISRAHYLYEFQNLHTLYFESREYMDYLLDKKENLNEIEMKNIKLIREHLQIINKNLAEIEMKTFLIKDYEGIFDYDGEITLLLHETVEDLYRLPNIGEDDKHYKEYKINIATNREVNDTVSNGERVFTEEELNQKVNRFVKEVWPNLTDLKVSGGGSDSNLGEYKNYSSFQNGKDPLGIQITDLGAHIISVYSHENLTSQKISSMEDAKLFAEHFLKAWSEGNLFLSSANQKNNNLYLSYVPKVNGIPLNNRNVSFIFDLEKGMMIEFFANQYFTFSKDSIDSTPFLTPDEAIGKLNHDLKINEEPDLEVINGKSGNNVLVYSIKVKGIPRVSMVYINAKTGILEKVQYENMRY